MDTQLLKKFGDQADVDIIDRLPTPFGLVRSGVAPDHQDTKVQVYCSRFNIIAFIRVADHASDPCVLRGHLCMCRMSSTNSHGLDKMTGCASWEM